MKLAESDAFEGYIEEDIDFNPTYKYNNGSNEWDSKFVKYLIQENINSPDN